mgnify:CR=1 FL=1
MLDCNCCSQILPESAFYKETRTKRGYQRRCKSCQKAGAAYSYEKNQDSVLARLKESYCPTAERDKKLKRFYGISLLQYEEMLISQDGKCLICGSTDSCHNSGQFVVDHCHSTEVVRGLLCHHCNLLLGHAKDSTATLQAAINYLNNHG